MTCLCLFICSAPMQEEPESLQIQNYEMYVFEDSFRLHIASDSMHFFSLSIHLSLKGHVLLDLVEA